MKVKFFLIMLTLIACNTFASIADKKESYQFHYESGDVYSVRLTKNTITWTGIAGSDKGISETDKLNRTKLSKNVHVLHWVENSGMFVTVVFDHDTMKTISSGIANHETWLMHGVAKDIKDS